MKSLMLCAAALLVVVLAGCKKPEEKVVVNTPDGTVTATKDGGNVTVTGPDGQTSTVTQSGDKTTYTGKDGSGGEVKSESGKGADMAGIGVPQYPGSTLKDDSSQGKVEMAGNTTYAMALVSTDPSDKVLAWYKGQLTVQTTMNTPEGGMVMGTSKSGQQVTVTCAKKDGKTEISVASIKTN